jgi:hypothetical protein
MTMINRTHPDAPPVIALTRAELDLLDELYPAPPGHLKPVRLARYLLCIAKLGGYLARARDPAPGNIVMWRGLSRLHDLAIGYSLRR